MEQKNDIKVDKLNNLYDIDNPPDPERVIEGLRDTGYDFNTAIADIIDNAIAAGATKIDVITNVDPQNNVSIYIVDNGCGMDLDELKNAMKYGSKRRNDLSSLGKFGLGLKTASTSFCRKLSLVSRGKSDSTVRKVQWDLDYVADNGWKLKQLTPSVDEEELLEATAGNGTGTVVVWENTDRILKQYRNKTNQNKALNKMLENLKFHISVVYQRFLDSNFGNVPTVTITLNGVKVEPWDPFCTGEANTEKLAHKILKITMPDGSEAECTLTAYAIPRSNTFSSIMAEKRARISTELMGFYIYRENRLIHYGDWLNMFVKDPHDSLLRVDFSFDHKLDEAFDVDIKKSRVMLNEEIYDFINTQFIKAPKRAANEKYRTGINKQVADSAKTAHTASNQNIESKASSVETAKVKVTDVTKGEVEISNKNGTFRHSLTVQTSDTPGECRVIPRPLENVLWKPAIVDGQQAVIINENHPYYQKVYYPVLKQSVMVTGMDALLWALAATEFSIYNDEASEMFEDIRYQVSMKLKKLLADLPEPEADGDDN